MSSTQEAVTLVTPDMSCEHCVTTMTKTLGALPGVSTVAPNLSTKQVRVTFDPLQIDLPRIKDVPNDAGYPVAD